MRMRKPNGKRRVVNKTLHQKQTLNQKSTLQDLPSSELDSDLDTDILVEYTIMVHAPDKHASIVVATTLFDFASCVLFFRLADFSISLWLRRMCSVASPKIGTRCHACCHVNGIQVGGFLCFLHNIIFYSCILFALSFTSTMHYHNP
jgi:hypothetical protein